MPSLESTDALTRIAEALGAVLLRSNRAALYSRLTAGIDDLDETLYPVLSGLARLGSATPTALAEQVGLDRSVTTRYAARLEAAGLLTRLPHPEDRRAVQLHLTDRGRSAIATSRGALRQTLAEATARWSTQQLATFADGFERLVTGIDALTRTPHDAAPLAPGD